MYIFYVEAFFLISSFKKLATVKFYLIWRLGKRLSMILIDLWKIDTEKNKIGS